MVQEGEEPVEDTMLLLEELDGSAARMSNWQTDLIEQ